MAARRSGDGDAARPLVVLVLQGGGALGAYHVGAYQALEEAGYRPDWICGTSIGAVNSAILVGNRPADRLERLAEFWHEISRPDEWGRLLHGDPRLLFNIGSAAEALLFGQPHFFTPRFPNPYFAAPGGAGATSFYDIGPLRDTLERLVDFARVNDGGTRLSLGATRVTTGELVFFDNTRQRIAPEHVMASGSLPPGFPAVRVDGELYWDGGCVSNTPLEAVLLDTPPTHAIVFMIDLWNAAGDEPLTMDQVLWREKQIRYASRTAHHIETVAAKLNLRRMLQRRTAAADAERLDIVHVIYRPRPEEIAQSDAEFSRPSIAARRAAGYADLKSAIAAAPWTRRPPAATSAVVHTCAGGRVTSRLQPDLTRSGDRASFARPAPA
jgi:NTE family protein